MQAHRREDAIRPPSLALLALEARVFWEAAAGLAWLPFLRTLPKGDGHAVAVFPGLVASDVSTQPLRAYLADRGYRTAEWGLGRNLGPRPGVRESCRELVRRLHRETGRKVSLIGWSLGGLYARQLASEMPEITRSVITLGSPFTGHPKATNAWRLYETVSGRKVDDEEAEAEWQFYRRTPPVPTTSILSRTDGVVAWRCSLEQEGPLSENIEVDASHVGLGVHPAVLYAVADRLAQPEGAWKRFDRRGLRGLVFKDPHRAATFCATRH